MTSPEKLATPETVRKALQRAYSLGQTYWQQADSESFSQNRKADETAAKFQALVEEAVACVLATQRQGEGEPDYEAHQKNGLAWAISRWQAEVQNRPLINVHRRSLDDAWRQVIRYFGGDPDALVGPSHDALLAASPQHQVKKGEPS